MASISSYEQIFGKCRYCCNKLQSTTGNVFGLEYGHKDDCKLKPYEISICNYCSSTIGTVTIAGKTGNNPIEYGHKSGCIYGTVKS